ncbi:hypothetical protein AB0I22_13190 [Streptomyces sp. NPDC050610]|uniref:hypothetical protein n=1 Tax=Streptomyces sp. NPDC050610 TaxID=3157097 RepID=UPI0034126EE1
MGHRAPPFAVLALLLPLAAGLLTACQQQSGRSGAGNDTGTASARQPTGYGALFLARGECGTRGRTSFTEVACTSERAAARVLARYNGPRESGPRCPDATDFVLYINALNRGASEERSVPEGYACMRSLQPPHPGDPGMGGGPLTVAGDCVYTERRGLVKETACDGSGARTPEYRVTRTVRTRAACPPSTALYVRVGGPDPVGCARRL